MLIHTQSGSIYEIDEENTRARRLTGNGPSTQRVGDSWRQYADLSLNLGEGMIIVWEYVIENDVPIAKSTITSMVLKITNESEVQ
jgi:hypothetical protein